MKNLTPIYTLLFLSVTIACSNTVTSQKTDSTNKVINAETPGIKSQNQALQKRIEQIAAAARGRVGVAAVVLETGESVALNSKERFPMQSVYKFPIGMAILHQIGVGKLKLDQRIKVDKSDFVKKTMRSPLRDENPNGAEITVGELLRLAISESDGTASDVLLKLAGGAEAVGKYLKEIEVGEMVIANPEKEIGADWETQYRNWASPDGAVQLLRALFEQRELSESSRALLIKLMTETPTGLNRLKKLLPKDTVVVHKTGTSGSRNGITAATNDIGIITLPNGKHFAVAVFVSDSPADEATREAVIAKIAKAIWDEWSK